MMKDKKGILDKVIVIAIALLIIITGVITGIILNNQLVIKAKTLENVSNEMNITETYRVEDVELINDEVEDVQVESVTTQKVGILVIPKLNVKAQILEGTEMEVLAVSIGHFKESALWEGNVALASHNRGNSVAHYFNQIHELNEGDEIIYKTNMGERSYKVYSTKEIENTDWSVIENTEENIITLITCITGHPEKRLCVQAKEN